jgi:hypothetical protein
MKSVMEQLMQLPTELVQHICTYLPLKDQLRWRLVNQTLHDVATAFAFRSFFLPSSHGAWSSRLAYLNHPASRLKSVIKDMHIDLWDEEVDHDGKHRPYVSLLRSS